METCSPRPPQLGLEVEGRWWQHSKYVKEENHYVDNSLWLWFLPHGLQEYFLCQVELRVFYLLLGGCQCCCFSGSETLPSLYLHLHHAAETIRLSTSFSLLPARTSWDTRMPTLVQFLEVNFEWCFGWNGERLCLQKNDKFSFFLDLKKE